MNERTGEFALDLHDSADIKRALDMQEGTRRIEVERGAEMQARMKREKVVGRNGRAVDYPEELIGQTKDRWRPVGRNGGAPSVRFGLSDAFERYEQGPDGLFFVWSGGWEPTRLWRNGAQSPQRDPDGNVWIERDGEWLLEDEVA